MPVKRNCPKCGGQIAGEALDGLCPNCVASLALAADPASEPTLAASIPVTEKPGDRIGRYKLLQQIGEGGCGVVYMAQQEKPVRRQVALKIIKLGMDTRSVIGRFEAERQALALMDHANIAKVFDAGATDTGRPFFVMELVRGTKITDYCDESQLSTRARLELFVQVCQAIQHAHQKGIIHRDIKPSNILVTLRDGVPVPKVIDFGIAKATTDQLLTDKTVFTEFRQFIGTPAYMSPEQAELSELGIDTRSDVYSLGILLYELLTGRTPFEVQDLLRAGLDEIRRVIREEEPLRPSTRLSTMGEGDLARAAQHRRTEAPKLIHLLGGDLDWIVMKAIEKDRTRRYGTASGLAMDVQRYLTDEPIVARPPSNLYRFQKMVRRHKLAFTATLAVVGALIVGLGLATWQFVERSRAYRRALLAEQNQTRLRLQAEAEKTKAQIEAAKSQQVAQLLKDMLEGVSPSVALGQDTTMLREIADRAARSIGTELKTQPEVEIELRLILARLYLDLELWKKAEEMAREILDVARAHFGEENLAVADALGWLGRALAPLGEFGEAETSLRRAIAMQRKLRGEDSIQEASALCILAEVLHESRHSGAKTASRAALAIYRKRLGNDSSEVASALDNLNAALELEGKLAEAEDAAREAISIRERINPAGHQALSMAYASLGRTILLTRSTNRLPEAEFYLRKALELDERIVGKGKFSQVYIRLYLAQVLQKEGKLDQAEGHYRGGIGLFKRLVQDAPKRPDNLNLGLSQWRLAEVLAQSGRRDQAEQVRCEARQVFEQAVEQLRQNAEGGNLGPINGLAWLLATCPDSSVRDGQRAVVLASQAVAATSGTNGFYLDTLAAACAETGQFAEAIRNQRAAMTLLHADAEKIPSAYESRLRLYESGSPYREGD